MSLEREADIFSLKSEKEGVQKKGKKKPNDFLLCKNSPKKEKSKRSTLSTKPRGYRARTRARGWGMRER